MHLRQVIYSESFKEDFREDSKHFTRNRKLPFPKVILFLLNFLKGSLQDELNQFFQAIHRSDVALCRVTASALCRARMRILPEAFRSLNHHFLAWVQKRWPLKQWCSHPLLVIDGTTLRFPKACPELADFFGQVQGPRGQPRTMAKASLVYDPLNKLTFDGIMAPYNHSELTMAFQHVANLQHRLPPESLFILDRGYGDFKFLQLLARNGHFFCFRARSHLKVVKTLVASGLSDVVMSLICDKNQHKPLKTLGISLEIPIRIMAFELSSGEKEFLVTNLTDSQKYPFASWKQLYHLRWAWKKTTRLKSAAWK